MQVLFFFSSRRRHTRLQGDWSSDVCSSDLTTEEGPHTEGRGFLSVLDSQLMGYREKPTGSVTREWGAIVTVWLATRRRIVIVNRSEERRVGKECRSRVWGEH